MATLANNNVVLNQYDVQGKHEINDSKLNAICEQCFDPTVQYRSPSPRQNTIGT